MVTKQHTARVLLDGSISLGSGQLAADPQALSMLDADRPDGFMGLRASCGAQGTTGSLTTNLVIAGKTNLRKEAFVLPTTHHP